MGPIAGPLMTDLEEFRRTLSTRCRIERMVLFGSRARGDGGEDSDLDILLVSPDFRGVPYDVRPVELRLLWEKPVSMDLICLTPEEFDERANRITIVRQALEEGVAIA